MSDTFDHEGDAWDSLLFGEDDGYWSGQSFYARAVTCRNCGTTGLQWSAGDGSWYLYKPGTGLQWSAGDGSWYLYKPGTGRHVCLARVLGDFEDLDDFSDIL
jgi:hypothetical protein